MTALGLFLLKRVLTQPRRWKAADTHQTSKGDEAHQAR